jgi:uncharacterized protein YyaL (SSP411 family)
MALNIFYLGNYFGITQWTERAGQMLAGVSEEMVNYGSGYSNWGRLALHFCYPFREVAIVGKLVNEKLRELYKHGFTNAIFAVTASASELPLLRERGAGDKTVIYVCENKACRLPVESAEEAIAQLE